MKLFITENKSKDGRVAGPEIMATSYSKAEEVALSLEDNIIVVGKKQAEFKL